MHTRSNLIAILLTLVVGVVCPEQLVGQEVRENALGSDLGVTSALRLRTTLTRPMPAATAVRRASLMVDRRLGSSPQVFRLQSEEQGGSGWKRGLVIGGLAGIVLGLAAHRVVDSAPCDSCVGDRSAAEGAGLEFAVLFGLGGAGLGALIGAAVR